jgi:hypothetical protein
MLPDALVHWRVATHIGPGARGCDEIRPDLQARGSGGPLDPSEDELMEYQMSKTVVQASSGSERDCEHALGGRASSGSAWSLPMAVSGQVRH